MKSSNTFNDSESIHLNKCIDTGILFNPTSKKAITAKTVVNITAVHVIICDPDNSDFSTKKPRSYWS